MCLARPRAALRSSPLLILVLCHATPLDNLSHSPSTKHPGSGGRIFNDSAHDFSGNHSSVNTVQAMNRRTDNTLNRVAFDTGGQAMLSRKQIRRPSQQNMFNQHDAFDMGTATQHRRPVMRRTHDGTITKVSSDTGIPTNIPHSLPKTVGEIQYSMLLRTGRDQEAIRKRRFLPMALQESEIGKAKANETPLVDNKTLLRYILGSSTDQIINDESAVQQELQIGYMKSVEGLEKTVQEYKEALGAGATDTSWHGQSAFVLADASKHNITPGFVVDIGAHDGIWQSNSYYFVQLGYPALLVEAMPETYAKLVTNVGKYKNAKTRNAAVSPWDDAPVSLIRTGWFDGTENRLGSCESGACVKGVSLPTLLTQNQVPKKSFLLSLDIEWQQEGYLMMVESLKSSNHTFDYIIVEECCNHERMAILGYKFIEQIGIDYVYRRMSLSCSVGGSRVSFWVYALFCVVSSGWYCSVVS